jgi:hypothetical protein
MMRVSIKNQHNSNEQTAVPSLLRMAVEWPLTPINDGINKH